MYKTVSAKGKRYQYGSAKKPLSPLFDYFQNELMGQNIILTSKMAAYRVSQNIVDMYNNDEEIDSPYYMLKNYFNSFNMDTSRSRVFKGAQYHLDQWLKRNKKYEKAMMKESVNESYDSKTGLFYVQGVPFTRERMKEVIGMMMKGSSKPNSKQFEYENQVVVKDKSSNKKVVIDSKNLNKIIVFYRKNSAKLASDKDF